MLSRINHLINVFIYDDSIDKEQKKDTIAKLRKLSDKAGMWQRITDAEIAWIEELENRRR